MNDPSPATAISPLRQRLIDDMNMRRFSRETRRDYISDVGRFATFLGRSPDTATAEDVRRFQIEQRDAGVPMPTMNSIVSALRFFFTQTIDRPDLARKAIRVAHPRNLPVVLSRDEVAIAHPTVLPSATQKASAPRTGFVTWLNTWPTNTPVNASPHTSRRDTHDSGPMWFAPPFIVRDSHPLLLPVSRRTCVENLLAWIGVNDPISAWPDRPRQ